MVSETRGLGLSDCNLDPRLVCSLISNSSTLLQVKCMYLWGLFGCSLVLFPSTGFLLWMLCVASRVFQLLEDIRVCESQDGKDTG